MTIISTLSILSLIIHVGYSVFSHVRIIVTRPKVYVKIMFKIKRAPPCLKMPKENWKISFPLIPCSTSTLSTDDVLLIKNAKFSQISTNRPCMPSGREGLFRRIREEHFHLLSSSWTRWLATNILRGSMAHKVKYSIYKSIQEGPNLFVFKLYEPS